MYWYTDVGICPAIENIQCTGIPEVGICPAIENNQCTGIQMLASVQL